MLRRSWVGEGWGGESVGGPFAGRSVALACRWYNEVDVTDVKGEVGKLIQIQIVMQERTWCKIYDNIMSKVLLLLRKVWKIPV